MYSCKQLVVFCLSFLFGVGIAIYNISCWSLTNAEKRSLPVRAVEIKGWG